MLINKEIIPSYIIKTADNLIRNGYQAYLVGGAVRDLLLDRTPKDFDIATDANPEQTTQIFPKAITIGAKFGNVVVITEDEKGEKFDVDVTTFREEENYYAGRWPNKVSFTKDITTDLSRRDFTVNAMAIDLRTFIDNPTIQAIEIELIDPFKGIEDLNNKLIRAVRNPEERFEEDGLRAIKACRLASELSFTIEEETLKAMYKKRNITTQISTDRIRQELKKIIKYSPLPSVGFKYLEQSGILKLIIPELYLTKGIVQPEFHKHDLFEHSLLAMDKAEDDIKVAALLHDLGKIKTISRDNEDKVHFYKHDEVGAQMARTLLSRLKFEKKEILQICELIKWHMFDFSMKNEPNSITEKGIRKFIIKLGGIEQVNKLIKLRIADGSSTRDNFDSTEIIELQKKISLLLTDVSIIELKDLNIKGQDLINLGYAPGPTIGNILNRLLDLVNEEPDKNTYHKLVEIAKNEFTI